MHVHVYAVPVKRSSDICAAQTLRSAARRLTRRYEEALRPIGLTASQYTILRALVASGGLAPGQIARALAFEQTTVTRLLAIMARRGLIAFEARERDRRSKVARVTGVGRALHDEARPLWERAQDRTLGALTSDEWAQARALLARLTD